MAKARKNTNKGPIITNAPPPQGEETLRQVTPLNLTGPQPGMGLMAGFGPVIGGGGWAGAAGSIAYGYGAAGPDQFFNGWGSIGVNPYGVPYGSWWNYWLMDRNPTVALASAAADAPIWGAEVTYECKTGVDQKIVDFIRDQMHDWERHYLVEFTRSRNDGYHVEEQVFEVADVTSMSADGVTTTERMLTLKKSKPLAPEITEAIVDEHGEIKAVANQGAQIEDPRRFLWLPYDGRGINPYGRSRKENYKIPWLGQEQLFQTMAFSQNVMVRPFGYVTYPFGMKDAQGNQINLKHNADLIGQGLSRGQWASVPDPFAPYYEQMIAKGIDPSKCMPYKIGWYDVPTDHGSAFELFTSIYDTKIVSGVLMPPRSILEAKHGSKADSESHSDTGVKVNERTLADICLTVSRGPIDTLLVQNFGEKYRGAVWLHPGPLVDLQVQFNNDIVKQTLNGPIGPFLLKHVVNLANVLEKSGVKCNDFDQDALAEEMDAEAAEQRKVEVDTAAAVAGAKGGGKPVKASMGDEGGGHWVTMDGVHVYIGKGGTIEKGPKGMVGKKPSDLKKSGKPITEHHGKNHPVTGDAEGPAKGHTTEKDVNKKPREIPKSAKSILAKQTSRHVDAEVQRYSEEHNEPILAMMVGGVSMPDGEPADVVIPSNPKALAGWRTAASKYRSVKESGGKPKAFTVAGERAHGVELKTMTDNKQGKVYMHQSAIDRKAKFVKQHKAHIHTVVFDDSKVMNANGPGKHDDSQRKIYYKRGWGRSLGVNAMHLVGHPDELRSLIETPSDKLPEAAKPLASYTGRKH